MPDFTMCATDHCQICQKCRRHPMSGTIPSANQSRSAFDANACNDPQGDGGAFWPLFETQGEIQCATLP